ncbi:glycosyltransferase family protein [Desulfofustis glycolicus]|uniref:Glycosyltransferase involved in cell wall bisynthesis n=1 Tax=Desulfofustis glycolicus DSM 9705 TaxID=1121409 RepID=A0A1M5YSU1_9BACT|nr:glycosyltransferase [Desulfofustis glycolicus]SHI15102.1 Glycosyltransferase involved in cell wall bisynthesis [Desulfofustis glycolicus DSM 9705]
MAGMNSKNIREHCVLIAWERHARTISLLDYLKIDNKIFCSNISSPFKYPVLLIRSFHFLLVKRPRILIVQNPSIVLSLAACLIKWILRYNLVVDAHNAAICPENKFLIRIFFIAKFIIRHSEMTIVTCKELAEKVKYYGGIPFVIPDKIPNISGKMKSSKNSETYKIVYICSFNDDEPFLEFFNAVADLPNFIDIYVTGNQKKIKYSVVEKYQKRIKFTNYLDYEDYVELLSSADLAIDLTYRENCLVCGAYEAVAVGTPLILSSKDALTKHFFKGVVFTENSSSEIMSNILYALQNLDTLNKEIKELKITLEKKWFVLGEDLNSALHNLLEPKK